MIRGQFIPSTRGSLFVTVRGPSAGGGCVLIAPPFAEELNKSRRMLADLMRALAERGFASVLPDLYGTAESEGEFREADWSEWQNDLVNTARWCVTQGWQVTSLVAVRLGCVLAALVTDPALARVERQVFWQPVTDGERFLTQFLRLRVAASMMEANKESVSGLRARLRAGESLEVAGYEITPNLARDIDAAKLEAAAGLRRCALHWFEVVTDGEAALSPAAARMLGLVRGAGFDARSHVVNGLPFWSTTEIAQVPELVSLTVAALTA